MKEQLVYGVKACLALFERRPQDLLRLHFRTDRAPQVRPLLAWMAERRLPFNEVEDAELARLTESTHHEGMAVAAQPLLLRALALEQPLSGLWVALDGVDNPFNAGAILRSAAFFGARGVLLGGAQPETPVNRALLRVSEGGAETVPLYGVPDLAPVLAALSQQGLWVAGLETDGWPLPAEPPPAPAQVLVLGNEQAGLGSAVRNACGTLHRIPGRGGMGSLNVSVAAGVALALLSNTFRDLARGTPARNLPGAGTGPWPGTTRVKRAGRRTAEGAAAGAKPASRRGAKAGANPSGSGGSKSTPGLKAARKAAGKGPGKPRKPGPKQRKNKGAPTWSKNAVKK